MAINGGTIVSYLDLDLSKYGAAMQAARQQANSLMDGNWQSKATGIASAMNTIGTRLTLGVTAPIVTFGIASAKSAMGFESAFAGVKKTTNATAAEFAALRKGIQSLSKEMPTSANDLSKIMEISGQLGVDKNNMLGFTKTMAQLAETTDLSAESAATMMAQYANVSGMDLKDVGRAGSVIVDLGNNCATTESQIMGMAQRMAGMANIVNLTDQELFGLAATMSSLGLNEEAGGSAMSRVMQSMQQAVLGGGKDLEAFAAISGVAADGFAAAWKRSPVEALQSFIGGLNRLNQEGADVYAALEGVDLNDIRVTDTLLRMAGAQGELGKNIKLANAAWNENNALVNEANKRYETTESKLQVAKNKIEAAKVSIGDALLPVVAQGAEFIGGLAEKISALGESTKGAVVGFAGAAAAAGPLLKVGGVLLKLFSGPAGWIALTAGAGLSILTLAQQMYAAEQAMIQANLEQRMGNVTLSAEEMQQVLDRHLKGPQIDMTAFAEAESAITNRAQTLNGLISTFDKTMYLAKLGVNTEDLDKLPELADQIISEAQALIDDEKYAVTLQLTTLFGEDSEEGNSLIEQINAQLDGNSDQLAAKGAALKQALLDGLADGKLDAADMETINNLRSEMQQIVDQAMLVETGGEKLRIRIEAGRASLTPESIRAFADKIKTALEQDLTNEEYVYEASVKTIYNSAAAGNWDDTKTNASLDAAENAYNANVQNRALDSARLYWDAVGAQSVNAFGTELDAMQQQVSQAWQNAYQTANRAMVDQGIDINTDEGAASFKRQLEQSLQYELRNIEMPSEEVRRSAAMLYEAIAPQHNDLRALVAGMDKVPEDIAAQLAGYDALEALSMAGGDLFSSLLGGLSQVEADALTGGTEIAAQAVAGSNSQLGAFLSAGFAAGQGFVSGILSQVGAARAAAQALANAAGSGIKTSLVIKSPSRVTRKMGGYTGEGFVGGVLAWIRPSYQAGRAIADAAGKGIVDAAEIHSPSRVSARYGDNYGAGFGLAAVAGIAVAGIGITAAMKKMNKKTSDASAAAAAEAAAAAARELERQQLESIKNRGQAVIAAEREQYEARMATLNAQQNAMLATIGGSAAWYKDNALDTKLGEVQSYYDKLQKQAEDQYEAQKKELEARENKDQLDAAAEAHKQRMDQLKEQAKEEQALLKEQYNVQKDIAIRWVKQQQEMLQNRVDAMDESARLEDYNKELTDLQKRMRQSKSAREKRELQEEIDRMVRDEALNQAQREADAMDGAWSKVLDAINAGIIGLGDLLPDTALPDVAFGSGGLGAIPNMSNEELAAVLKGLVNVTQVAEDKSAGNSYSIDLTGAVIRDDSDIYRIIEGFEERMRSLQR